MTDPRNRIEELERQLARVRQGLLAHLPGSRVMSPVSLRRLVKIIDEVLAA